LKREEWRCVTLMRKGHDSALGKKRKKRKVSEKDVFRASTKKIFTRDALFHAEKKE